MIERLQRIATFLHRFQSLLLLLAIAGFIVLVTSFFDNPWIDPDQWLIPSLAFTLWALVLFSLSSLFHAVPAPADASMGWRERLSRRLRRGGLWILGLMFVLLSLSLLMLTYQLLRVALF